MSLLIKPNKIKGIINPPSSKSVAIRKIIIASFIPKETVLRNIYLSEDVLTIIEILKQIGIKVEIKEDNLIIFGGKYKKTTEVIDFKSSATCYRIMLPILLLYFNNIMVHLNKDLLNRPFNPYTDIFKKNNISIKRMPNNLIEFKGKLKKNYINVDGSFSSQFVSGMVYYLCFKNKGGLIKINNKCSSLKYLKLTIDELKESGFKIKKIFNDIYVRKVDIEKLELKNNIIETDYTQASNFISLAVFNKDLEIGSLSYSKQPDYKIFKIFKKLGCKLFFDKQNNKLKIISDKSKKISFKYSFKNNLDIVLNLGIVCANLNGKFIFKGIENLKYKESDRLWSLEYYLQKMGCNPIYSNNKLKFHSKTINNYFPKSTLSEDHRVIMMLTLMGLIQGKEFVINNNFAVNKSYPTFFEDLQKIGVEIIENK